MSNSKRIKVCPLCGVEKPRKSYYINKNNHISYYCKRCHYTIQTKWKKLNKFKVLDSQKRYRNKHKKDIFKYTHSKKGKALQLFRNIKHRLKTQPSYANKKLYFERDMFLNWLFNKSSYLLIYKKWKESNWLHKFTPTIDRINNNKHYTLSNIQILSSMDHHKKSAKEHSLKFQKINWSKINFEKELQVYSCRQLGIKLGVTASAIFKHLKTYNLKTGLTIKSKFAKS